MINVAKIETGKYETKQTINGITYIIERVHNGQDWCWTAYDKNDFMADNMNYNTLSEAKQSIARCAELNGWEII